MSVDLKILDGAREVILIPTYPEKWNLEPPFFCSAAALRMELNHLKSIGADWILLVPNRRLVPTFGCEINGVSL